MKKLLKRIAAATLILAVSGVLAYLVSAIGLSSDPKGKYSSYEFYPHSKKDVLRFADGIVTLETCCGNEAFGSYSRDSSGDWIWVHQYQRRPADPTKWHMTPPQRFVLRRTLSSLQIEALDPPFVRLEMKRRLFNDLPF